MTAIEPTRLVDVEDYALGRFLLAMFDNPGVPTRGLVRLDASADALPDF